MKEDIGTILDQCLTQIDDGKADAEACLAEYPEHAEELRPLLAMAQRLQETPKPSSSATAFADGKQRMLNALAEKKKTQTRQARPRPTLLQRLRALFRLSHQRRMALSRLLPAAAIALLIAIVGGVYVYQLAVGPSALARTATVDDVQGQVQVLSRDGIAWQTTWEGQQLQGGDRIRTQDDARAKLLFHEGSHVRLEPGTELAIRTIEETAAGDRVVALYQQVGGTSSQVEPAPDTASAFEIETPAATAAVRGTAFTLEVEASGRTTLAVSQGMVALRTPEEQVTIAAGLRASAAPGEPPIVVENPVPPEATEMPTPGLSTETPRPSDRTETPEPPGLTRTPQPPGLTDTPEPPGLTNTPGPPDQTDRPDPSDPPDGTEPPDPPGLTNTPQPPGLTKTPQPPGQTKTPQPPGQDGEDDSPPPGEDDEPPPGQDGDPPPGQDGGPPPGQDDGPPPGQDKPDKP